MDFKKVYKELVKKVLEERKRQRQPARYEDVAKVLGYTRSYFSTLLGDTGKVTPDHIKNIKLHFPFLSENETSELNEPELPYIKQRLHQKNNSERPGVPVFGGFTTLGNIEVYDDSNERNEIIGILPPNIFPGSDHAEKAKGDSMYPLIMNQALLVGKKCPVDGISYGEKYIIKTKQGLDTTKFIHPVLDDNKKKVEGKILLVAYNKSIPAQEINLKDVVFACRVLWIVNPT